MNLLPSRVGEDGLWEIPLELDLAEASSLCSQWVKARALWLKEDFTATVTLLRPLWIELSVAAIKVRISARCVQLTNHGAAFELMDLQALHQLIENIGATEVRNVAENSEGASDDKSGEDLGFLDASDEQSVEESTQDEAAEDAVQESSEESSDQSTDKLNSEGDEEGEELPKTEGKGSLHHRLKALTVDEKKRLAVKANHPERHFLARDVAQGIHIFVLRNPGVTANEVAEFLKNPRLSAEAVLYIGKSTEWMTNRRVVMALCTHARAPSNVVMRLISRMSQRDLKSLQRSGRMKPAMAREIKSRLFHLSQGRLK